MWDEMRAEMEGATACRAGGGGRVACKGLDPTERRLRGPKARAERT